jgi:hypothetical protein
VSACFSFLTEFWFLGLGFADLVSGAKRLEIVAEVREVDAGHQLLRQLLFDGIG